MDIVCRLIASAMAASDLLDGFTGGHVLNREVLQRAAKCQENRHQVKAQFILRTWL
jgi:hypothetical protein